MFPASRAGTRAGGAGRPARRSAEGVPSLSSVRALWGQENPILSVSMLIRILVRLQLDHDCVFPDVYNEDWLPVVVGCAVRSSMVSCWLDGNWGIGSWAV
jgi:hypothetical protein